MYVSGRAEATEGEIRVEEKRSAILNAGLLRLGWGRGITGFDIGGRGEGLD